MLPSFCYNLPSPVACKVKVKVKQSHYRPVQEIFLVLISVRGWSQTQGHSAAGRKMSVKNFSDTIGNRTRDLPTCSVVPQLTAPPCAPPVACIWDTFNSHFTRGHLIAFLCLSWIKRTKLVMFGSSFFWYVTQRMVVVVYRRFKKAY